MQNKFRKLNDKARFHLDQLMQEIHHVAYNEGYEAGHAVGKQESIKGVRPLTAMFDEFVEKPKSANQQRAELIERAKKFIKKIIQNYYDFGLTTFDFVVNAEKRTVVALERGNRTRSIYKKGVAKCNPSDVFNEWIGKAISLARALQIDIPVEFLEAVRPTKSVIGTIVERHSVKGQFREVAQKFILGETCTLGSDTAMYGKIIDDTNAQYELNR